MIQNLLDLIKENSNDLIVNNSAINNEFNDEAITETSNVIVDGLKKEISNGNIAGLTDILKSNGVLSNNPIIINMINGLSTSLSEKFNVDAANSKLISEQLIPNVIEQLVTKTNDPNDDSFTTQGLLSEIGGSGIGGMIINLFGNKTKSDNNGGIGSFFKKLIP